MIDKALLSILACPVCKGPVHEDSSRMAIICETCQLAYPLKQSGEKWLPLMLKEEASPLQEMPAEKKVC